MGQNLKGVPVQRMSYTIIGEYRTDIDRLMDGDLGI
jgi:hypothetical protein